MKILTKLNKYFKNMSQDSVEALLLLVLPFAITIGLYIAFPALF